MSKFKRKPQTKDWRPERQIPAGQPNTTRMSTYSGVPMLKAGDKRVGYLFNFKNTTVASESGSPESALYLYFVDKYGKSFSAVYRFQPYFLVDFHEEVGSSGIEAASNTLKTRFPQATAIELVEKDDLDQIDHLSGRKHTFVKMTFPSMDSYTQAKRQLMSIAKENSQISQFARQDPLDYLRGLSEHDVPLHVRVCIDHNIRCAKWYNVSMVGGSTMQTADDTMMDTSSTSYMGNATLELLRNMLTKPDLRVFAWDIETSKAPLKFPDSSIDPIIMISVMADGRGYLLVNREEVVKDIEDFDYSPKPDMEGNFRISNCEDEKSMLQAFYNLIKKLQPQILVTFNGDNFDFPYVAKRSEILGLDMGREIGVYKITQGAEEYFSGRSILHIDCYAWVQRDSYLPQGAQGLKMVTKYKLKYDPVELDPEDIAPFARTNPQALASYSVSDALATYFLFKKYIQDFVFALCTVIPTQGDEVLRKGSGTLCELLLMAEAFRANVVFPNKHAEEPLQFHNGRLIETSTYEGGRVECLRTGIYRDDFAEKFSLDVDALNDLADDVENVVDFFLIKEMNVKKDDVVNYSDVVESIKGRLRELAASPVRTEQPLIYHLDVAAMYPNIILSNRLQPSAIVNKDACAACSFNKDAETNKCQRKMAWKWRGELYKATKADVQQIQRELEAPAHRYNSRDAESGEITRVPWKELGEKEKHDLLIKNVRTYSTKAYKRVKSPVTEDRTDIVCQRENGFYIDTVRAFRDRRYEFKDATKQWKGKLEAAEESGDIPAVSQAKDMILLFDSLQLAHKCILNSFYGYVMRKGARWHSMKMAGIVTFTGSNLIREAREFVDKMGLPLELDTDGIWCLLPKSFPDRFKLELNSGKAVTMTFPCSLLNVRVHRKYSNHQYQTLDKETGEWKTTTENSIFFEIDGPYKAMVIPASTEEDRMLKKRYAVFNFDGSIAELKGFEIKRRGELKLVQVFQENVFPAFLQGTNREEVYAAVGRVANKWIHVLDTKGAYLADSELIYLVSERKNMSKSVEESGDLKSASITTARRIAAFLGESILREKGISCHLVIANRPVDASATERAIPIQIFSADEAVKRSFLRKWLNDPFMTDFDIRAVIDWDYYKTRLGSTVQKLVIIPALEQRISNPCPSIEVVEWMRKRVAIQNDKFQQTSLSGFFKKVDGPLMGRNKAFNPTKSAPKIQEITDANREYVDIDQENEMPEMEPVVVDIVEDREIEESAIVDPPSEGPKISDGQISEWAAWQKAKWKDMRVKRLQTLAKENSVRGVSQQSSLTQDILRASAAGLAAIGGSGIKNRRLGVMPWHIVSVEESVGGQDLILWVTLGEVIQKISIPLYRKRVVKFPRSALASEFLDLLPKNSSYREISSFTLFGEDEKIENGTLFEISCSAHAWQNLDENLVLLGANSFENTASSSFEFSSKFGAVAQVKDLSKIPESFYSYLAMMENFDSEISAFSVLKECKEPYMSFPSGGLKPLFIHFSETASPSIRAFASIFSESGKSVFVGFVGVPPPQRPSKPAIEKLITDGLLGEEISVAEIVESGFFDTVASLLRAVNKHVDEVLRRVGAFHSIAVVSSEGDSIIALPSLKTIPHCRSPFSQLDQQFPALDWARWVMKRFTSRAAKLLDWWDDRLWLARLARVPVCQLPASREAFSYALDVLLARALKDEVKMVQWNIQSDSEAEAMAVLLPERSERVSCSEISSPGIYRSVCLSLNLKSALCVAALSRASQQSLERGLASDKQLEALFSVVDSLVQRGKAAQTKFSKLLPQNELEHRHVDESKLAAAEAEMRTCAALLGGLYGWLSNPSSNLYSPELLSKATQAMNATLDILLDQLKKTGCQIVFANFTKVVFATGKSSVQDVGSFWSSLRLNLAEHPILRALSLDESSVSHAMYGMMWFDSSNYACIPVDRNGEISWRVEAQWKLGECLPPALRAPFYTYTSEFLMKPMKALMKLGTSGGTLTNAQKTTELTLYILNSSIPQTRKKLYNFISDVEQKRQTDMVIMNAALDEDDEEDEVNSDDSDFQDPPEVRRQRRINELRAKWEFPSLPGVQLPQATKGLSPAVEFAKFIWEMIALERIDARAIEEISAMRNDLLKFFKLSPFSSAAVFENPIKNVSGCKLVNVSCNRCGETSTSVDVVAGPFQGPGLWECTLCGGVFDRDMVESRLVSQVQTIVRGWQTQTLRCEKCKCAKTRLLAKFCECSGRFQTRINREVAVDAIKVIESVALAHNLQWLEQTCKFFLSRI